MNSVYLWILVTAASVIASVLVFLGIRKLPFCFERGGSFSIALTFFMMLFSPEEIISQEKKEKTVVKDENESHKISFIKEFGTVDRWYQVKAFWRKLDLVEPKKGSQNYMNALSSTELDALHRELVSIFGYELHELQAAGSAMKQRLELETIVYRYMIERLDNFGTPRYMLTRMMPPPSAGNAHILISDIEKQIDLLLQFKKSGKIGSREYFTSLEKIQKNIYINCVLDVLEKNSPPSYFFNPIAAKGEGNARQDQGGFTIDEWILGYESSYGNALKYLESKLSKMKKKGKATDVKAYKESLENMKKSHESVKMELLELKKLKPKLDLLIKALEK